MCMFGGPAKAVDRVEGTNIFARALGDDQQLLVYSMNIAAREPVAMILPIPVPPGSPENAVRFIDMKGYPKFFHDLDKAFPVLMMPASRGGLSLAKSAAPRPKLKVHEVGDFVASFVPSMGDFDRLDERFRLSSDVWDALPRYADYGFAVFQLKDLGAEGVLRKLIGSVKKKTIHPMAFSFPMRDPSALFFPTVHVHDGRVHAEASFDHHLYAQLRAGQRPDSTWTRNDRPLGEVLERTCSPDIVDFELPAYNRSLMGRLENADTFLHPEPDL